MNEQDYDKAYEAMSDHRVECGCYEMGDMCYDGQGEFTHATSEECNN